MLRKSIPIVALAALAFGVSLAAPARAQVDLTLSAVQGFKFTKTSQSPAGFLTTFTLGTTTITPDFVVTNPTTLKSFNAAVVLTSVSWSGKMFDPITIVGRISAKNRQAVIAWKNNVTSTKSTFGVDCFAYDPISSQWFQNFHDQAGVMSAFVGKSGSTLEISVSSTASTDVTIPINYKLTIIVAPQLVSQNFEYATSPTSSILKPW